MQPLHHSISHKFRWDQPKYSTLSQVIKRWEFRSLTKNYLILFRKNVISIITGAVKKKRYFEKKRRVPCHKALVESPFMSRWSAVSSLLASLDSYETLFTRYSLTLQQIWSRWFATAWRPSACFWRKHRVWKIIHVCQMGRQKPRFNSDRGIQ